MQGEQELHAKIHELEMINKILINKILLCKIAHKPESIEDVRPFGKENLEYISERIIKKYIKFPSIGIPELIKMVHYNERYPENNNVRLNDANENTLLVYNGKKWIKKDLRKYSEKVVENSLKILEDYYEKIDDKDIKLRFANFQKRFYEKDERLFEYLQKELKNIYLYSM